LDHALNGLSLISRVEREEANVDLRRRRRGHSGRESEIDAADVAVLIFEAGVDGVGGVVDLDAVHFVTDGVDQDDYVTSGGTKGFEAPTNIRADQILDQGVRLPYFKFPRNPTN